MLKSIKIGRKEYPLKKGDYIINSENRYTLYAGDGRTLKSKKYIDHSYISLTKKTVKGLKLENLCAKKIYRTTPFSQVFDTKWFIE